MLSIKKIASLFGLLLLFCAQASAATVVNFTTTQPLKPHEGLTIVVGWSKDLITHPTQASTPERSNIMALQEIAKKYASQLNVSEFLLTLDSFLLDLPIPYWFGPYPSVALLILIGMLVTFLYYLRAWHKVGEKEPLHNTPSHKLPNDLSPIALACIQDLDVSTNALSVILITMATKKFLTIETETKVGKGLGNDDNSNNIYRITRISETDTMLAIEEKQVANALKLHQPGDRHVIDGSYSSTFDSANKAAQTILEKEYVTRYLIKNKKPFLIILGLSLATLALFTLNGMDSLYAACISFFILLVPSNFNDNFLMHAIVDVFKNNSRPGVWKKLAIYSAICFFVTFVLSVFAIVGTSAAFFFTTNHFGLPFDFPDVLLNLNNFYINGFIYLVVLYFVAVITLSRMTLTRYSEAGQEARQAAKSLTLYLTMDEKDRMQAGTTLRKEGGIFEKYLPYALALHIAQQWTKQFAHTSAASNYQPSWYQSSNLTTGPDMLHRLTTELTSSFSNNIESSTTAPIQSSSSSFSSSSGFSSGSPGDGGGGW